MKIRKKNEIYKVDFHSLAGGDTFYFTNDTIWMKTEYIETSDSEGCNAVDLSNGAMGSFANYDSVTPVKINAVIEG